MFALVLTCLNAQATIEQQFKGWLWDAPASYGGVAVFPDLCTVASILNAANSAPRAPYTARLNTVTYVDQFTPGTTSCNAPGNDDVATINSKYLREWVTPVAPYIKFGGFYSVNLYDYEWAPAYSLSQFQTEGRWDYVNAIGALMTPVYECPADSAPNVNGYCTCKTSFVENSTHDGCSRKVVDIHRFSEPLICEKDRPYKNPIYPMTGAKKEVVGTGFIVGGRELTLTYDSMGRPSSQLWYSNFHVSMGVVTLPDASLTVTVTRSGGKIDTYSVSTESGGDDGVCGGLPAKTTSINKAGAELQIKNEVSKTIETYTLGGQLTGTKDALGNATTPIFSDANTPASIAPAPGYLLKVTDGNGRSVNFTYVLQTGKPAATGGLIKTITNSAGQTITLGYDATWNLSSLTWPDAKVKTFVYEDPVVLSR